MIELEKWKRSSENPNMVVHDGQRTAYEVYRELESHSKPFAFSDRARLRK